MAKIKEQYEWENDYKVGIIEILSYSIAIGIVTGLTCLASDLLIHLFGFKLPSIKSQLIYSSIFYAICFLINIPILFTLGKKD